MGSRLIKATSRVFAIGILGVSFRVALRVYLQTVRGGVWTRNESKRTRFGFNSIQRAIWDNLKIGEHAAMFSRGKTMIGSARIAAHWGDEARTHSVRRKCGFHAPNARKRGKRKIGQHPSFF
jgi:hypothetical protein